jgi:serine/threonine protein kinase
VIEYLHSNKIIYRDLKASHIFLNSRLKVTLIDLGFAKPIPKERLVISVGFNSPLEQRLFVEHII